MGQGGAYGKLLRMHAVSPFSGSCLYGCNSKSASLEFAILVIRREGIAVAPSAPRIALTHLAFPSNHSLPRDLDIDVIPRQ